VCRYTFRSGPVAYRVATLSESVDTPDSSLTWPAEDFNVIAPAIAVDVALLLSDEPRWVHRRVETVTYRDETSLRRQTSVDFTIPKWVDVYPTGHGSEIVYIPITLLDKRLLEDFDLRDEAGTVLSLLPRAENFPHPGSNSRCQNSGQSYEAVVSSGSASVSVGRGERPGQLGGVVSRTSLSEARPISRMRTCARTRQLSMAIVVSRCCRLATTSLGGSPR
jgi:hypothetical protein